MSVELRVLACVVLAWSAWALYDDPRCIHWVRAQWSGTVGAWFARRRFVEGFLARRRAIIRIGSPDEHSAGLLVSRRDMTTGCGV